MESGGKITTKHIWDVPEIEGNGKADINNSETPIHIVIEDVNFETQQFSRQDAEPTVLEANFVPSQEHIIHNDGSDFIDDCTD